MRAQPLKRKLFDLRARIALTIIIGIIVLIFLIAKFNQLGLARLPVCPNPQNRLAG